MVWQTGTTPTDARSAPVGLQTLVLGHKSEFKRLTQYFSSLRHPLITNLFPSPRSSNDWNLSELLAYRISVAPIKPQEFFGQEIDPPLTGLDPALINNRLEVDNPPMSEDTERFLWYLRLITKLNLTAASDFARELLRICDFEERGRYLRTGHIIPFVDCGENKAVAQPTVSDGPTQS